MKTKLLILLAFLLPQPLLAEEVSSPDGKLRLDFQLKDGGKPSYSLDYAGGKILADSHLGFELGKGSFNSGFKLVSKKQSSLNETWKPVYGERSTVRNHYNQLTVELKHETGLFLALEFRCFDGGAAFRYRLKSADSGKVIEIRKESSEFAFTADHLTWATNRAQGSYKKTTISKIGNGTERPLVIRQSEALFVAIAEANLVDFARMKLGVQKNRKNCLVSQLSSGATIRLPYATPWRVVMVADSPGRLIENNDLILNLNPPCAIKDASWIKPGKVIREVTLTTQGGKTCVDFAAKHNLQYVEFDAGWYGNEYDSKSDATTITVDPKRSPGPLDLHEVIRYAKERGVGIIVYVNRRALEKQLDKILPLYQKWGVAGVKYGFVNVGSQTWTAWLHDAVRKAAKHRLMVDVHDEYRPTGYCRTYPNLMTQEGILGDEQKQPPSSTLKILFSRLICGAADNTICYYDPRVDKYASHAYQLAKAVCIYSPWQFVYWYDRPENSPQKTGGAGGRRPTIGDEPELEFFDSVPTVWDETKVLRGSIGEFAVFARRSGKNWFIGCMNADQERSYDVKLDFLEKGRKYTAHIYSDDQTVKTRTRVKIERKSADSNTTLVRNVKANSGFAVRIVPVQPASE